MQHRKKSHEQQGGEGERRESREKRRERRHGGREGMKRRIAGRDGRKTESRNGRRKETLPRPIDQAPSSQLQLYQVTMEVDGVKAPNTYCYFI